MNDLPKNIRNVVAVLSLLGMGIGAYAYAQSDVDKKIDKSEARMEKAHEGLGERVSGVEKKMDRVIEILLRDRR